jgi:hypothetical protein
VEIDGQQDDIRAAVAYARSRPEIDRERVAPLQRLGPVEHVRRAAGISGASPVIETGEMRADTAAGSDG